MGSCWGRDVGADDQELVPTEPPDDVPATQVFLELVGARNQDGVTGCMPMGVVDGLEVVEVEEGHRDLIALLQQVFQRREDRGPVVASG